MGFNIAVVGRRRLLDGRGAGAHVAVLPCAPSVRNGAAYRSGAPCRTYTRLTPRSAPEHQHAVRTDLEAGANAGANLERAS